MARKYKRKCNCCDKDYVGYGKMFCSKICSNRYHAKKLSKDRVGKENPMYGKVAWNYSGGRKHKIDDYKIIGRNNNGGRVFKHRNVMETFLKRRLGRNEIVHHVDGDIHNNDIRNLRVMTRGEHTVLHNNIIKAGVFSD